ncbi:MAG TPA: hypothetical protein PLM29_12545 [Deltaproteobacteria bacterium]|nr:hypothetical protein [Deltaproteobacteria bacterium]
MKRYRLLMHGRNYLISTNGKPAKQGFFQNLIIEAESPQKACLLAKARITHDRELRGITLNTKKDPPVVELDTFWELDVLDDVGHIGPERTFYLEKRWWQFWRTNEKNRSRSA